MYNKLAEIESQYSATLAYGEHVKNLLTMNDPKEWVEDLWTIYTGFMVAQRELGHNRMQAISFARSANWYSFSKSSKSEKWQRTTKE